MYPRLIVVSLVASLALAMAPDSAHAESHDIVTFGVGAGVTYSSASGVQASATSFQFNARLKLLYFLGFDVMLTPASPSYDTGGSPARFRMSALLYMLNFPHFAMFGAAGLAGDNLGDTFSIRGESTLYRAGGGMEVTLGGHYSIGVEGFWLIPGVDTVEENVRDVLLETGQIPQVQEALPMDGYELFFGLRYFF